MNKASTDNASANKIHIVGIGDDGLDSLTAQARALVLGAELLVGTKELLATVSGGTAERLQVGTDLDAAAARLSQAGGRTVVLVSGDPLFYGLARYLCDRLGKERFEVLPHVSSMQLAFARVKESWEDAYLTNLATHPLSEVVEKIRTSQKVGLFTSEQLSPQMLARELLAQGIDYFSGYVCENLGSPDERVTQGELSELATQDFGSLNVMVLLRKPDRPDRARDTADLRLLGNPDEAFLQSKPKKGLITPAEVRAMVVAQLGLLPQSVVWDVGAGSGSVAIECAQVATGGQTFAIEMDAEDHELIRENAARFAVKNLKAVLGQAPQAWEKLPDPDAIFLGGTGREIVKLVEPAWQRLKAGGRLVANVGSIESLAEVHAALLACTAGTNLWMVNIARGTHQLDRVRFDPLPPTFLLSATKPR